MEEKIENWWPVLRREGETSDKMDDQSSVQIVLFADFDSGNMARYERVAKTPASLLSSILAAQYTSQATAASQKNASSNSSANTG